MNIIQIIMRDIHLLNAWILAIPVWLIGIATAWAHRKGMRRATDMSWYKPIDKLASTGSLLSMITFMIVSLFVEMNASPWSFYPGIFLAVMGAAGHFAAKIAYAKAGENSAATAGVYQLSRNPMYASLSIAFLGAVLCSQSLVLGLIWISMAVFSHLLIIGEERYCLTRYGESYKHYMRKVSRYFLFF